MIKVIIHIEGDMEINLSNPKDLDCVVHDINSKTKNINLDELQNAKYLIKSMEEI